MNFTFTEEQAMIADTAGTFFAEHASSSRTRKAMESDGIDKALWQSYCQDLGFGGIALPESAGGAGLGVVELAILAEAAGARVAALPMLGSLAMAAQAIAAGGGDSQKAKWLPLLISGEKIAAYGENADLVVEGNHLTGQFDFVAHGGCADIFVLAGKGGAWIIDAAAAGVSVRSCTTMDQTRPFAQVTLDKTLGDPLAKAEAGIQAARKAAWICVAAEALGGAQATLDQTVAYSLDRVQFGRPIGSFQAYKHRLADMMVEIEQARSAVYWAACAVDEAADDAALALHCAKSFAADTYMMCAANMIQLHGGIGITWEHDCHLYFKRARAIQSMLGTSNWHREKVAELMGLGAVA